MGQSLSARVFWLIVGIILLIEILAVIPGLGRERQLWLWHRMTDARLVAISLCNGGGTLSPGLRSAVLQLSETEAISVTGATVNIALLPDQPLSGFGRDIDLNHENLATSVLRAATAVLGLEAPYARLYAAGMLPGKGRIQVIISQRQLARRLRLYVAEAAGLAVALAGVTGSLVFLALNRQLVRPMRVMTASIAGFRRNPGHGALAGLQSLGRRGDDEIARAARELVAMQDELRAALWRNARLAALGTAVAKISHDLRNILSSALLVADRLERHADPVVNQAAGNLIPAIERAVALVASTLDFAQDGPPAVNRSAVRLHALIAETADMLRSRDGDVVIENLVPGDLVLSLDRNHIYRVLVNLLRNAMEAGASRIVLAVEVENGLPQLVIGDNGHGLPDQVIANLFRPFTGSGRQGSTGLGLAIARDLVRAHGGDLSLRRTGPAGTEFAMALPGEA